MNLFCKLINRSSIACRAHSFITSQIVENNKRMVSNLNDSNITTDPWIGDVFLTIVFSRSTLKKENVEKIKRYFVFFLPFHWRTLIWVIQWPYYELRYQIKVRKGNLKDLSLSEKHNQEDP